MTFPLGLTAPELRSVEAQMRGTYRMRVRVELLDMAHRLVQELSSSRIGGSVQIAADSEASTRSLSLELFDPTDMLGLGDGSSAVSMNRMVQVHKGIFVETGYAVSTPNQVGYGLGTYGADPYGVEFLGATSVSQQGYWVDVPVFCGPVSKPSRSSDILTIEANDKVALAVNRSTGPSSFTVRAGTNAATAIRQVMQACTGETRFRIASTSRRLSKSHAVSREQSPWQLVQRICNMLGWVCFFDGAGYLVCKPRPTVPVAEFRTGPGGSLTGSPTTGYWDSEMYNQVTVIGGVVSKTTITATVTLPAAHPLSPENLATGSGVRRFLTLYVEDSEVSTYAEALELAARRLREVSIQQTTVAAEIVAFWHMQEYDVYTVPSADGSVTGWLNASTIQLSSDGNQSIGYLTKTARQGSGLRVRPKSARLKRAEAKVRR